MERKHGEKVEEIRSKVEKARERRVKTAVSHGNSHSVQFGDESLEAINVGYLDRFLEVDGGEQKVLVEPDISMRRLVDETLRHGLIPYVVPEFPEITVGGAVQGGAGESSSFKYGGFSNHCGMLEIVTGDGRILETTPDENQDLFYGTACSYGSLGILTAVEIDLKPAKEHVRLAYSRVESVEEAVESLRQSASGDHDFVDAIMFSRDRGVVMKGKLEEVEEDLPVKRFNRARDEWFYIHVDRISRRLGFHEEYVPIKDYLFRYDTGAFWTRKYGFDEFVLPFNRLTRTLLHPFMRSGVGYDAGGFSSMYILQDIVAREEDALELLDWVDRNLGIYPLWLLPMRPDGRRRLAPNHLETGLAINIGIWGPAAGEPRELKERLEQKAMELGARKSLYAHQFYTEEEFWSIYDKGWYRQLRQGYGAEEVFPDVYSATHTDSLPEPSRLKAFASAFKDLL